MRLIVVGISAFLIMVGVVGVVAPLSLGKFVDRWKSGTGLWAAAVLRVVFGIALWVVAPSSRAPLALQVLAVVTLAAGILLPVMGYGRYEALLVWWQRQPPAFVRLWCFVAGALGVFLLWAVLA